MRLLRGPPTINGSNELEVSVMACGIAAAVDEMVRIRDFDLERHQPRERITRAITAIDLVLDGLERLNLNGRSELPEATGVARQAK